MIERLKLALAFATFVTVWNGMLYLIGLAAR